MRREIRPDRYAKLAWMTTVMKRTPTATA